MTQPNLLQAYKKQHSSTKPPPYVKIKKCIPYGNCPVYTVDPADLQSCNCDPRKEAPCGPDSDCLNRMLLVECHPAVCPAGDKCGNMK